MTRQKDLKRHIRARMQKTGESYTAARARVVRRESAAAPPVCALPANYLELTRVSDTAVQAKTGRTWPEWVATLDAFGAAAMTHADIAARVHALEVPGWWAQTVTVGYERIRGLRERGQSRAGSYAATKSKTVAAPLERLYAAFTDTRMRRRWLPATGLKISTATPSKYLRMRWSDGAHVNVGFAAKGTGKSQVAVEHNDLPDRRAVEVCKAYWAERLAALAALLT